MVKKEQVIGKKEQVRIKEQVSGKKEQVRV